MAKTLVVKPLGLVLQKAGLVSPEQVKIALEEQKTHQNIKIGQILAIKGWINPHTADFFAEQWAKTPLSEQPLGQYFKQAGLLDEIQIETILGEQAKTGLQFGAIAVIRGFISQQTLDFFLEQLELIKIKDKIKPPPTLPPKLEKVGEIEHHLLHNHRCESLELLRLYQAISQRQIIKTTSSTAEIELLKSGLVVKNKNRLKIGQSPYQDFFDENWLEQQLVRLAPYSKIRLKLSGLETKASLPYKVLQEVRYWTDGQPYLTQKIHQIIKERESFISRGKEAETIEALVQEHLIDRWSSGVAAKHLLQMHYNCLQCDRCSLISVLKTYKKIWQERDIIRNDSPEQDWLLSIGLIKEKNGKLKVANRIYKNVFDRGWVEKQLATIKQSVVVSPSKDNHQPFSNNLLSSTPANSDRYKMGIKIAVLLLVGGILGVGSSFLLKYRQVKQFQHVDLLWQQQDYQQAVKAYDQLLQTSESDNEKLWVNRGYALAQLEQYEAMLQSCASATLIKPQTSLAWNCQGEAYYRLGKYQSAREAFKKAIDIYPQQPIFWLNQTETLLKLQEYHRAYASSNKTLELLQKNPSKNQDNLALAYSQQGQALLKQKKYQPALSAFQKSLELNSKTLNAQQGKAIALYELGEYQQASKLLATILKRQDLSPTQKTTLALYQGVNFCGLDNTAAANRSFQNVLQSTKSKSVKAIASSGCGIK